MRAVAEKVALVLGSVVFVEVLLQAMSAVVPTVGIRLSGLKPAYVVDERLGVRGDPALADHDIAGFRNAVRPETTTVVAIGDSQTAGSGVPREGAWPQLLGQEAGLDVYQFAFGSYGPGQYLSLVDDALSLSPELIVIAVYFGNDFADAYRWAYEENKSPPDPSPDPEVRMSLRALDRTRGGLDAAWARTRDARRGHADAPVRRWLRTHVQDRLKLYALYEQIEYRLLHRGGALNLGRSDRDPQDVREKVEAIDDPSILCGFYHGEISTVFTPAGRFSTTDLSDPRVAEGLRLTQEAIRAANRRIGDDADLLVMLVPNKETVYANVVAEVDGALPRPLAELVEAEDRARRTLVKFLEDEGIAVFDPVPALAAFVAGGGAAYPNDWDGHPNVEGNREIARALVRTNSISGLTK